MDNLTPLRLMENQTPSPQNDTRAALPPFPATHDQAVAWFKALRDRKRQWLKDNEKRIREDYKKKTGKDATEISFL